MSNKPIGASAAPHPDAAMIRTALEAMVRDAVEAALPVATIVARLRGDLAELSRLSNAKPVTEGRIIEQAVRMLAACNPDLALLPSKPLPLLPAAAELAKSNPAELLRGISFDSTMKTSTSYLPDLIAADRTSGVVHLIDVKRSLGHYNSGRVDELKFKMLTAALVVPDLIWRRYWREPVREVRIAIVDASGRASPMAEGVVPIAHFDDLVGVSGAAAAIAKMRQLFEDLVQANFDEARRLLAGPPIGKQRSSRSTANDHTPSDGGVAALVRTTSIALVGEGNRREPSLPASVDRVAPPGAFRIGFARIDGG